MRPATVYDLVCRREIPCVKIGGQWRFPEAMLWEWIYEATIRPEIACDSQQQAADQGAADRAPIPDSRPRLAPGGAAVPLRALPDDYPAGD